MLFACVLLTLSARLGYGHVEHLRSSVEIPTSNSLNFFFVGDWGNNVNADASESGINHEGSVISKQIAKQSEAFQPEFFIMLGDNFYDTGVANVTDKLWTIDYRNLYSAPSTQVPWYAVLGNHDYYSTKPSPYTLSYTLPASLMYPPTPAHTAFAEIEYSMKKIDQRWNMPSNFYSRTFPIKGSSKTLEIVFIDTVILAPNHHNQILTALPAGNQGPAYDGSGDDANVITSTAQLQLMQPYLAWIEKTLSESTADYRIVAGHYHVYTTTNGDDTVPELVTYLVPIMKKYGVIAYINGHEHNAEHMFYEGIHYITVGHGCDKDDPIADDWATHVGASGLLFNETIGSFAAISVSDTQMSVQIIDEDGNQIHKADLGGPQKVQPPTPKHSDTLNFFFYGDWGNEKNQSISESGIPNEAAIVAKQVQLSAQTIKPDFFVMLGDNYYDIGVADSNDPLWAADYSNLYTDPATQVPWYAILGNHDYYSPNHTQFAQIEYWMKHVDNRWYMPDYFYTKTFLIPGSTKTLDIFFIDTVILAPNHKKQSLTGVPAGNKGPDYAGSHDTVDSITSPEQLQLIQYWLARLDADMSKSTATYKVVAGHYHVYTTTAGDDVIPELETFLVPLMKKYGVIAYINGHEHNAEHIFYEGINYITLGHGCDKDDPVLVDPSHNKGGSGVLFSKDIGSFGVMTANDTTLSFVIIDESGNEIYNAMLLDTTKPAPPTPVNTPLLPTPHTPDEVRFFFYAAGDWGNEKNQSISESGIPNEAAIVAKQVQLSAQTIKPDFFVMLGDNYYDIGVADSNDPLWAADYSNLYTDPATQVPWYAILGNHDYYSPNHTQFAQIEYWMKHIDNRWNMPDHFYTQIFPVVGTSATIQIFFIDTVILAPNHKKQSLTGVPAGNKGPAYDGSQDDPNVITSAAQLQLMQPYLAWLEDALAKSTATYKIVAGHYHVYTTTVGDDTVPELVNFLVPLMKKYHIDAYINGHEHNAEHMIVDGINYITVGHGCDKEDPIGDDWASHVGASGLLFNKTVGSFGYMRATATKLTFEIIDEHGNTIYQAGVKDLQAPTSVPTFAPTYSPTKPGFIPISGVLVIGGVNINQINEVQQTAICLTIESRTGAENCTTNRISAGSSLPTKHLKSATGVVMEFTVSFANSDIIPDTGDLTASLATPQAVGAFSAALVATATNPTDVAAFSAISITGSVGITPNTASTTAPTTASNITSAPSVLKTPSVPTSDAHKHTSSLWVTTYVIVASLILYCSM